MIENGMRPRWFGSLPLLFALLVPFAAAQSRIDFQQPVIFPGQAEEISDPGQFYSEALRRPELILLRTAVFDPLSQLEQIPLDTIAPRYDKSGSSSKSYYFIQARQRISSNFQNELKKIGVEIIQYIPNNALLVGMSESIAREARKLPDVRWTGEYHPAFRLEPELSELLSAPGKSRPDVFHLAVQCFHSNELDSVIQMLMNAYTGHPAFRLISENGRSLEFQIPSELAADAVYELVNTNGVRYVERRPDDVWLNDNSIWACQSGDFISKATPVFDQGILGRGQVVAVADSGLNKGHCAFTDLTGQEIPSQALIPPELITVDFNRRKVIGYNVMEYLGAVDGDTTDGHGTHVSGSVAGDDFHTLSEGSDPGHDLGDGMAPQAKLMMIDGGKPGSRSVFFPYPYDSLWQQEYGSGANISNNSWGSEGNAYNTGAAATDEFVFENNDFLIVVSAGNAGPASSSLGLLAQAKNLIAVAASYNGLTGANSIATYSSKGPAYDGRIKPDLSAPGDSINSARSELIGDKCSTLRMGGTSMSSPTVAGLAALVRQYYTEGWYPSGAANAADSFTPSAALLKATLINSCANMTGGNTGVSPTPVEDAPAFGQGWGRVTLDEALYFSSKSDQRDLLVWDLDNDYGVETNSVNSYPLTVSGGEPLKATLVWTDPPAAAGAATALVHDLDLELVGPGGTLYRGNQWNGAFRDGIKESKANPTLTDNLNNVEGVLLQNPQAGEYMLRVRGANIPGQGDLFRQGYALVVTGGVEVQQAPVINIGRVTVDDSSGNDDGVIDPGETVNLLVELENVGGASAGQVSATLASSSPYLNLVSFESAYSEIPAGSTRSNQPAYQFTVLENAPSSENLSFVLNIQTENAGSFSRTFMLKVRPGSAPVLKNFSIQEVGVAAGNAATYVNISFGFDYEDADADIQHLAFFFRVNGVDVNFRPVTLTAPNLGTSGSTGAASYDIWQYVATNTGETFQLVAYLEDATGRRSQSLASNEITFTKGTTPGSPLMLNDDDSLYIPFPDGFVFPFYGRTYNGCWLNSDGNITFEAGFENMLRSPSIHLGAMPRISGLYTDLAKSPGQNSITVVSSSSQVKFNWNGLPQWSNVGPTGTHTFSITLFPDGAVELHWGTCTLNRIPGRPVR